MHIAHFKNNAIQTVKNHLLNTGELCCRFSQKSGVVSLCEICGYIHDIGKYSHEFQQYIHDAEFHEKNGDFEEWKSKAPKIDHGVYAAKYIYGLCGDDVGIRRFTADIIAEVVCYHHGGLPDNINEKWKATLPERIKASENSENNGVKTCFDGDLPQLDISGMFDRATAEIGEMLKKFNGNSRFWVGLLIKYIYSVLIDADRLDCFLFETDGKYESRDDIQNLWEIYNDRLRARTELLNGKTCMSELEKTVNESRMEISDDCFDSAKKPKGIYTLTVPTGGGKTLASMRFALNHAMKHGLEKIVYVVPYTTLTEQNAKEIRDTLECGDSLLEYHSNVVDCNKNSDYEIVSQRFSAPIIFTTTVRFLDSFYGSSNSDIRRMHSFENAVVIFDEIQALPIKCTDLFYSCVNYLKNICGSTILFCSATQPDFGLFASSVKLQIDGEIVKNVSKHYSCLKRMNITDKTVGGKTYDIGELAEFITQIKAKTKSILAVMNTVDTACGLFEEVKKAAKGTKVFFLSSRLCPEHRKHVIKTMKECLNRKEDVICISTQLIEAGVDISFSATVRSLCGLDSIAQTTGRGNRHGENDICNSYIVKLKDENISNLLEIRMGQKCTSDILYLYSKDGADKDLLSPKMIAEYYNKFYGMDEIKENLKYPLKNSGDSIYDLLLEQKSRTAEYFERNGEKYPLTFSYQFEKARKNFEPIDSKTISVIVPYAEGRELILKLLGKTSAAEKFDLLSSAQRYCVNIYNNLYRELSEQNAFINTDIDGILLLDESFYSDDIGITKNRQFKTYLL